MNRNTMKFTKKIEFVLIGVVSFLCVILCYNILKKLRSALAWRVNCWFCNTNTWVKFPERNCWTCPRCEQYNGFNKDGDYNKPLLNVSNQLSKSHRVFHTTSPAKNGLCKMCNINQQLKVTQLANYVPMNDMNFDDEIESYRLQLERAYKLCSPCKKNVQMKLHKEKEVLLGSKAFEARTPEKKRSKETKPNESLQKIFNKLTTVISICLLALLSVECYTAVMNDKKLSITMINIKEIFSSLLERAITIMKAKVLMTFPFIENYTNQIKEFIDNSDYLKDFLMKYGNLEIESSDKLNETMQGVLGGVACLLQIMGHILNVNNLKYAFIFDLMWTVFVTACVAQPYAVFKPITIGLVKVSCVLIVLSVSRMSREVSKGSVKLVTPPKRLKNLAKITKSPVLEDSSSMDTDDDVSLTKFGLHNFTDSSNDNVHVTSFNSGRVFSPRVLESAWSRPALNSTFESSFTSRVSKSPSSVSDTVFAKPAFEQYQNLTRDDSDSDLDESISGLCISSPKKAKQKTNSMFSLRKFAATPSFVTPLAAPLLRKPLISPSKLGHGTSWVAGGYWGAEAEREPLTVGGSRSSSQSSGFESQASSVTQRTDWGGGGDERLPQCAGAPVFPQMQYNGHVQIPHYGQPVPAPRRPPPPSHTPHFTPSLFKAPGGLIKLPQAPFPSR